MAGYKKVVVSGNIIELYQYDRQPVSNSDCLRNDNYNVFEGMEDFLQDKDLIDMLNDNVAGMKERLQEREDRKAERRGQTLRDARNTTRRLALMNFNSGDKFLTLTFDPKKVSDLNLLYSIDWVDNEFKKFIKRFNYKYGVNLKYIAVREQHKTGRLHFHMLCNWDKELIYEDEIREVERYIGEKVWKHGFVDIKILDHVDNVGAYIIKYMTKAVSIEFFKGKKVYLCSKGLERPLVYKDYQADLIIQQYELEQKKEVFTNSYISEYLGKVTYKEYNLVRVPKSHKNGSK